jgi:hypothetical protein
MKGCAPPPLELGCEDLAGSEIYDTIETSGPGAAAEVVPSEEILAAAAMRAARECTGMLKCRCVLCAEAF